VGCRSKEWEEIGKKLTALPRLITLTVEDCDAVDSLCTGIYATKSLECIRMGMWVVNQNAVASVTMV
jgi:hypothetical protein